jgi:hypothetical protein
MCSRLPRPASGTDRVPDHASSARSAGSSRSAMAPDGVTGRLQYGQTCTPEHRWPCARTTCRWPVAKLVAAFTGVSVSAGFTARVRGKAAVMPGPVRRPGPRVAERGRGTLSRRSPARTAGKLHVPLRRVPRTPCTPAAAPPPASTQAPCSPATPGRLSATTSTSPVCCAPGAEPRPAITQG